MPHKIRFARLIFNVQTLKADGKSYEDIFTSVQMLLDITFRKIKPYGNVGDKKNDGFLPKTGYYFQVYAPENPENPRTIKNAISKLVNDFSGLYKSWNDTNPIQKFHFVINDKQRGCPPDLELKIVDLRNMYPSIEFATYTLDNLLDDFCKLSQEDMEKIVGVIPNFGEYETASIPEFQKIIDHLLIQTKDDNTNEDESLIKLEFEEKILFNKLTSDIAEMLRMAEIQSYILDDYFSNNEDKYLKTKLRNILSQMYISEKVQFEQINELNSSLIFFKLLDYITQNKSTESLNASLILIAFYFDACDIFEIPQI
jgi:hypothetical protein